MGKLTLYQELLIIFEFDETDNANKSRFLAEKLIDFCNFHSYEPAHLAWKIISETNKQLNVNTKDLKQVIQEMNKCLFENFKKFNITTNLPERFNAPALTKDKKIRPIKELVLSDSYPTGAKTELIFSEVYNDEDYISSPEQLGLVSEDVEENENYLRWLGISDFVVYQEKKEVLNYGYYDYVEFVKEYSSFETQTGYRIDITEITNLSSILNKISIEKLILWVYYDQKLNRLIDDTNNGERFEYHHYSYKTVYVKPSYVKYLILKRHSFKVADYLIDDKYDWVNEQPISYNSDVFKKSGISKSEINGILMKLGAKDNFTNLTLRRIIHIIQELPRKYPKGNKSQTVYKKVLQHFKENGQVINIPVKLFANDGTGLRLYENNEVYFSEKIKLPKRLYKDFPIFNFPARAGGADAIKFFGVNDLKELTLKVEKFSINNFLSDEFSRLLNNIKPSILTVRINSIEELKAQKLQASICNQIEIVICNSLSYRVKNVRYNLGEYEYLHQNEFTYYLVVKNFDSLQSLRRNTQFMHSFSDIIALSFDVNSEKNEFKSMLRLNLDEVIANIIYDYGNDTYLEAKNLLGLADLKQAFWSAIFSCKGINYENEMDDLTLEELIKTSFNLDFNVESIDYDNLRDRLEVVKVRDLFNSIKVELKDFLPLFTHPIGVVEFHSHAIKNKILTNKKKVKTSLWNSLMESSIEDKKGFLTVLNTLENYDVFAEEQALKYHEEFYLDLDRIFHDFVFYKFGVLALIDARDLNLIKDENSKDFDFEELELINESERFKSLLFFKNSLSSLKDELNKIKVRQRSEEVVGGTVKQIDTPTRIINGVNIKVTPIENRTKNRSKGIYLPSVSTYRNRKQKGDSSEKIVLDYMNEHGFENVDWVSRDNENLKCDIRYSDKDGEVISVDVKSFDSGTFYMSKSEYDFGKKNQDFYEIWLVKNKTDIIIIKDFFSNSKYENAAQVNEYLVYLEI